MATDGSESTRRAVPEFQKKVNLAVTAIVVVILAIFLITSAIKNAGRPVIADNDPQDGTPNTNDPDSVGEKTTNGENPGENKAGKTATNQESDEPAVPAYQPPKVDYEAQRKQAAALRASLIDRKKAKLASVQKDCDLLMKKSSDWKSNLDELLSGKNEIGNRIASDEKSIKEFILLLRERPMDKTECEGLGDALAKLADWIETARDNAGSTLSTQSFDGELNNIQAEIRPALEQYEDLELTLAAILDASAESDKSVASLQEEIQKHRRKITEGRLAELRKVDEEENQKSLDAEIERRRAAAEAKRKHDVLVAEAQDPAVLTALAPILALDFAQPKSTGGETLTWERLQDKKPVSFSRIKTLGCLEENNDGRRRLLLIFAYKGTDRPRWGMRWSDPKTWSTEEFERVLKVQGYLRKYGDVLVELGKLSP